VLIVERNAKFLLNPIRADLFTAENAGQKEEIQDEDSRLS
jgi:hypothetical protein